MRIFCLFSYERHKWTDCILHLTHLITFCPFFERLYIFFLSFLLFVTCFLSVFFFYCPLIQDVQFKWQIIPKYTFGFSKIESIFENSIWIHNSLRVVHWYFQRQTLYLNLFFKARLKNIIHNTGNSSFTVLSIITTKQLLSIWMDLFLLDTTLFILKTNIWYFVQ